MVSTGRVACVLEANRDVEVDGIGRDAVDRPVPSPKISADDAHVGAVIVGDIRN